MDYRIGTNDMISTDISTRLAYVAGEWEKERFLIHVEEFTSVTCLILVLAGRLAKAEENIVEEVKDMEELMEEKRNKLVVQLYEARELQCNIDKRAIKVNS